MPAPSQLHQAHVASLLRNVKGSEKARFWKRLRESCPAFAEELPNSRRVPDAFLIEPEKHTVTVYEVEITGLLTSERIMEWADLWWLFDTYSWELALVTIDRFGVHEPRSLWNVFVASVDLELAT